jgi:hypothetical protein
MSPYAREHIKAGMDHGYLAPMSMDSRSTPAHNGRETRGVLAKSTPNAIGTSARSILRLFLTCTLLILAPLLSGLLALVVVSYRSSLSWQCTIAVARRAFGDVHPAALLSSIYVYWSILCVGFGMCCSS